MEQPSGAASDSEGQFHLLTLLCAVTVYFTWYPGIFTPDEIDMVSQGLTGHFHDWHSPLLVRLWRLTGMLKAGPALPYLLASFSAVWLSSRVIRTTVPSLFAASVALLIFAFVPPVFVTLGLVTKDLFFVSSMLAALLCLVKYVEDGRRLYPLVACLAVMQVAILIRMDAAFALLPLAVCGGWTFLRRYLPDTRTTGLLAVGVAALMLASLLVNARVVNRVVLHATPYHPEQPTMLFDLAAISVQTNRMLIPPSRLGPEPLSLPMLKARFSAAAVDPLIWGPDRHHVLLSFGADQTELNRAWIDAVWRYPGPYLKARAEYAARLIGIRNRSPYLLGLYFSDESLGAGFPQQGWLSARSPLQRLYFRMSSSRWSRAMCTPWIWLLAGMCALTLWSRRATAPACSSAAGLVPQLLVVSAISYTSLMCLVSASDGSRYHSWPRIAVGLVAAMALAGARREPGVKSGLASGPGPEYDAAQDHCTGRPRARRSSPTACPDRGRPREGEQ